MEFEISIFLFPLTSKGNRHLEGQRFLARFSFVSFLFPIHMPCFLCDSYCWWGEIQGPDFSLHLIATNCIVSQRGLWAFVMALTWDSTEFSPPKLLRKTGWCSSLSNRRLNSRRCGMSWLNSFWPRTIDSSEEDQFLRWGSCAWPLRGKKSASQEWFIEDRLVQEVHKSKMNMHWENVLIQSKENSWGLWDWAWLHNLMDREDNEHLKHVCMRMNLVTEPDTAWQGIQSCIAKLRRPPT
jgi:hypothetical protein